MLTKENLWDWYCSLTELEQTAIAAWLLFQNATLIFAFEETSDVLKDFGRVIRDELKQSSP